MSEMALPERDGKYKVPKNLLGSADLESCWAGAWCFLADPVGILASLGHPSCIHPLTYMCSATCETLNFVLRCQC
jgi:hypothetical protein